MISMPTVGVLLAVVGSVLAGLLSWLLWTSARWAHKYDLKNMPGPKQAPIVGNLGAVIGSSYLHRVSCPCALF